MLPSEEDIRQITETVWSLVLHMQAQQSGPGTHAPVAGSTVSSCVEFSGRFNGRITLSCDSTLARGAASVMFDRDDLAAGDVLDAVGELCNMIGGNVRALLPEPCLLSLPHTQADVAAPQSDARTRMEMSFLSGGHPFFLHLSEKT